MIDVSAHDILKQAIVGLEFEFYSNKDRKQVAKELEKETMKKTRRFVLIIKPIKQSSLI